MKELRIAEIKDVAGGGGCCCYDKNVMPAGGSPAKTKSACRSSCCGISGVVFYSHNDGKEKFRC